MTTILLLVDDEDIRDDIRGCLEVEMGCEVIDDLSDGSLLQFDLCIGDRRNLMMQKELLQKRADDTNEIFLPIVLVTERDQVLEAVEEIDQLAHEILLAPPIDVIELQARLEILLRTRVISRSDFDTRRQFSFVAKAIENVSDAVVMLDREYQLVYSNDAFKQLLELDSDDDLADFDYRNALFQDEEIAHIIYGIMDDKSSWDGEIEHIYKNGEIVPLLVRADCVLNAAGDCIGIIIILTNILERKKVEKELSESRERFRELTENINQVFWLQKAGTREIIYASPAFELIWGIPVERLYEDVNVYMEAIHPEDIEKTREAVEASGGMGNMDVMYRIVRPDSSIRTIHARTFPVENDAGEVYRIAGLAEDITDELQIQESARDQRVLAEAMRDAASILLNTLDFDEVFEQILQNVGRVVPHSTANIMFIQGENVRVIRKRGYEQFGDVSAMPMNDEYKITRMPHLVQMLSSQQPLIIPDVEYSPYPKEHFHEVWAVSYVGTPIILDQEVIGFLNLVSAYHDYFTPIDADRLVAFAEQVAIAIRNAQAYEQGQALAALEERQRLARNLHDAVSQTLFSARVLAETLPELYEKKPELVQPKLIELQRLTRGAQAEMRTLLLELRPSVLNDANLSDLLQQLVDSVMGKTMLDVKTEVVGDSQLPSNVRVAIYYIMQEAFNNIVKHAEAENVYIELTRDDHSLRLIVRDDGKGFTIQDRSTTSMGLLIMEERADSIGAELQVRSEPGQGAEIEVNWHDPEAERRSK